MMIPLDNSPFLRTDPSASDLSTNQLTLPQTSSPPISPTQLVEGVSTSKLSFAMGGTVLGKMVRDLETTFRVMGRALQVAGAQSVQNISQAQVVGKIPAVAAALLGTLLYGTSLLTLAAIKTVIWVPMVACSAVTGGLGAILGRSFQDPEVKEAVAGFVIDVDAFVGNMVGLIAFVPSLVLLGVGVLAAYLIDAHVGDDPNAAYKEVSLKLLAALKQANGSNCPVNIKPLFFSIKGHQLSDKENTKNLFLWLDQLGVDFNETGFLADDEMPISGKQQPLLIMYSSGKDFEDLEIRDQDELNRIKTCLQEAGIWNKLHQTTKDAFD